MKKLLNKIRWILARFKRTSDSDHIAEVVVYLDGQIIERRETHFNESETRRGTTPYYNALVYANGIVSCAVGMERRRMKGRA